MCLLTAGGQAGGDGRRQHATETQRVQPGAQGENRQQGDAEGDAEGEQRQSCLLYKRKCIHSELRPSTMWHE